eukprot:3478687-Rhodomonas_salina.3
MCEVAFQLEAKAFKKSKEDEATAERLSDEGARELGGIALAEDSGEAAAPPPLSGTEEMGESRGG